MWQNNLKFTESDLCFFFDAAYWQVRKYDAHTYFRGFSGLGLKGVDFVAIYADRLLVLLEVKNYTWRARPFREKNVRQSLQEPAQIAAAVVQKMEDTQLALRAIQEHYRRKRSRSWAWLDRFRKPDVEQLFWEQATALLEEGEFRCYLWLEREAEDEVFAQKLRQGLSVSLVQGQYAVELLGQSGYPYEDTWGVSHLGVTSPADG